MLLLLSQCKGRLTVRELISAVGENDGTDFAAVAATGLPLIRRRIALDSYRELVQFRSALVRVTANAEINSRNGDGVDGGEGSHLSFGGLWQGVDLVVEALVPRACVARSSLQRRTGASLRALPAARLAATGRRLLPGEHSQVPARDSVQPARAACQKASQSFPSNRDRFGRGPDSHKGLRRKRWAFGDSLMRGQRIRFRKSELAKAARAFTI